MVRETKNQIKMLQKCLERAELEGLEPEEYAKAHPGTEEVRGELVAARWLEAERSLLKPETAMVRMTRSRLMNQIGAVRRPKLISMYREWVGALRTRAASSIALLMIAAAIVLNCTVLINTSSVSIPGDFVYPIKLGIEGFRLAVSLSPIDDAGLHIDFAQRRLTEMQYLALEGRYENIASASRNFKRHLNSSLVILEKTHGGQDQRNDQLGDSFRSLENESNKVMFALSGTMPFEAGAEMTTVIEVSALHHLIADALLNQ